MTIFYHCPSTVDNVCNSTLLQQLLDQVADNDEISPTTCTWLMAIDASPSSSFNFVTMQSNPITVTVSNNREPVLYDLGFGLRSRLLGYWVAADWAYGVDDGITLPRRFTLSLNFDF